MEKEQKEQRVGLLRMIVKRVTIVQHVSLLPPSACLEQVS